MLDQGYRALTLQAYERQVEGQKCRWCGADLPANIQFYPHPNGWDVVGYQHKLWLYVRCPRCGYDWALWKLGIRRGEP